MTITKLSLFNRALRHLRVVRLANLNENVKSRNELDAVYDDTLQACLEMAGWKFAIRTSLLTPDSDIEPNFGLSYVYAVPDDFAGRWVAICVDDMFRVEDPTFREENGVLYSNQSQLYVKYVSNGTSYGLDLGKYPENYAELVGITLAERACLPITKDDKLLTKVQSDGVRILLKAKTFDAIKDGQRQTPPGRIVTARFGNSPRPGFRNGRMTF